MLSWSVEKAELNTDFSGLQNIRFGPLGFFKVFAASKEGLHIHSSMFYHVSPGIATVMTGTSQKTPGIYLALSFYFFALVV